MEIWQAYSVEQTVYFESQTDRVLIYVQSTAVIVLKYRGILSLDWTEKSVLFHRDLSGVSSEKVKLKPLSPRDFTEAVSSIKYKFSCALSEDSKLSAHLRSLIRALIFSLIKHWTIGYT